MNQAKPTPAPTSAQIANAISLVPSAIPGRHEAICSAEPWAVSIEPAMAGEITSMNNGHPCEEVSSMSDLLKLVERASESNLLLAEEFLARTAVGDAGQDPSAPPAAGGAL